MQLNPYLAFNGTCEEAFKFYESCLGGKIESVSRFAGSPMEKHMPAGWGDKIMHARLRVGDTILMGSDGGPEHYQKPQGTSIALMVDTAEEAERVFQALSEGGSVQMPIQQTFWAVRFGMLADRYGVPWMIDCELPKSA